MKKFYSIMLMAAALLVGTNVKAGEVGSLADLKAAIANGDKDITLTTNIALTKTDNTLDFAGATLHTGNFYLNANVASVEFTIKNVTIEADAPTAGAIYTKRACTINLENVKSSVLTSSAKGIVNVAAAGATLNIDADCELTGVAYAVYSAVASTIVNNGTLKGTNYAVYAKGANVTNNGTLEANSGANLLGGATFVNNGVVNAKTNYALYVGDIVTIENNATATFPGKNVIELTAAGAINLTNNADLEYSIVPYRNNTLEQVIINNAGTLHIQPMKSYTLSGKITITNALGASVVLANSYSLSSELEVENAGTFQITAGTYQGNITIANSGDAQIANGTFNGAIAASGTPVEVLDGTFNSTTAPEGLLVSGGKWAVEVPAAQLADGFACKQALTSTTWFVRAENNNIVASIGEGAAKQNFTSLKAAFEAAADGDVIKLEDNIDNMTEPAILYNTTAEARRSITLDLNDLSITTSQIRDIIVVLKGSLLITGKGTITNNTQLASKHTSCVELGGYENPMSSANDVWTSLVIDKNVKLRTTGNFYVDKNGNRRPVGVGISIYHDHHASKSAAQESWGYEGYPCPYEYAREGNLIDWDTYGGKAYGIDIDVYGEVYGNAYSMYATGTLQEPKVDDANSTHIPFIHVHDGAILAANETEPGCAGLYMSGNVIYVIDEATITGANGIYVKGGELTLNGTTVTATGAYADPVASASGIDGSNGNAIVYDSHDSYTGNMALEINDAQVDAAGYAVLDVATKGDEKLTSEGFTINGGEFTGGTAEGTSCLSLTADLQGDITVNGGINGGTFSESILEYLNDIEGMITEITDENGNTVYYVENIEGGAPEEDDWIKDLAALATASGDDDFKLTAAGSVDITGEVSCRLLQLLGAEKIFIKDGGKLTVSNLVIDAAAVVEVEVGGKLIITDGGIVSNNVGSLVVDADENGNGIVLIQPGQIGSKKADTNPKATVNFVTKAYYKNGTDYEFQRFGLPVKELEAIICAKQVLFYGYSYETDKWAKLPDQNALQSNEYYQMLVNATAPGTQMAFQGRLEGNSNLRMSYAANAFVGFANSYTANINLDALRSSLTGSDVVKSVYMFVPKNNEGTEFGWQAFSGGYFADPNDPTDIAAMQAFILLNEGDATEGELDYEDMVWTPATAAASSNPAPARRSATAEMTTANIIVKGGSFGDKVRVFEGTMFSSSRDEGEAVKYMNEDLNIYVSDNKKMSIFATNDLSNTYVGFSTVSGGTFTISFENINGNDLTLVDLTNGMRIAMIEGNVYEFEAEANSANDYRFQIVGSHNAPTGVENVSAANSGAVYTIMGQYVGEMSDWNTLPAGIYVVDGVKRVK